jgi:hypothetical protein
LTVVLSRGQAVRVTTSAALDALAADAGAYARVHRTPSRKVAAWAVAWPATAQPAGDGFWAVDKPGGIPMQVRPLFIFFLLQSFPPSPPI